MISDPNNTFRRILADNPPTFLDRVNTPWEDVPDVPEYNGRAYNRIERTLQGIKNRLARGEQPHTEGVLILGEAGTGKTHLLMRVAKNLAETNHILFVRKPNNEVAVAQHIWADIVTSLTRSLPGKNHNRTQLDDLLANVFAVVLIRQFENDIQAGKDVEQKQRWINHLKADSFNLFNMLGEGEKRQDNMNQIRRRTLRFLQDHHPEVDQKIAHALITYCLVITPDRKRLLLTWLAGQDIDSEEAKSLGLTATWVVVDETTSEAAAAQQREEIALRAIRSIGILSTYYQPLILAFDQLEGLRDQLNLTKKWGDTVREIFTMTPNLLMVTCIFPSLWEEWFQTTLDQSTSERIAQQKVELEKFGPQHGQKMLTTHLRPSFESLKLPNAIYPFTSEDVDRICQKATSPRKFLQEARSKFQEWLDGDPGESAPPTPLAIPTPIGYQDLEKLLEETLDGFLEENLNLYDHGIPNEADLFGRAKSIFENFLGLSADRIVFEKLSYSNRVLPQHLIVRFVDSGIAFCLGTLNCEGNAFAARIRNLLSVLEVQQEIRTTAVLRDQRCRQLGPKSQEYVSRLSGEFGFLAELDRNESAFLNAIYDTLVAIEEHDLTIGQHEISKRNFLEFLRGKGLSQSSTTFRELMKRIDPLKRNLDKPPPQTSPEAPGPLDKPIEPTQKTPQPLVAKPTHVSTRQNGHPQPVEPVPRPNWDVLIGDSSRSNAPWGMVGTLREGNRKLAISFNKPLCISLFGYMGSGKSYGLAVLVENALGGFKAVTHNSRPLSVIAFNFRRNSEARFEYGGFGLPNSNTEEIKRLAEQFGGQPGKIETMRVFGHPKEIQRRAKEYGGLPTFPISFKPNELKVDDWEILLRPPSPQSEYMDVIRDVIQELYYKEILKFSTLRDRLARDPRLNVGQSRQAMTRLSFAEKWITDDRPYEWADLFTPGSFNIIDLRAQAMNSTDALKICLVLADIIRRTKNGVNKVIVFDEAHEYVDAKDLVDELQNMLTQIRHDGLSFILASQFPERLPGELIRFLTTRFIFKLPSKESIQYLKKIATNLGRLPEDRIANLDLERGVCFVQTDDDSTDPDLRFPNLLDVRPRCTQHHGATVRQTTDVVPLER